MTIYPMKIATFSTPSKSARKGAAPSPTRRFSKSNRKEGTHINKTIASANPSTVPMVITTESAKEESLFGFCSSFSFNSSKGTPIRSAFLRSFLSFFSCSSSSSSSVIPDRSAERISVFIPTIIVAIKFATPRITGIPSTLHFLAGFGKSTSSSIISFLGPLTASVVRSGPFIIIPSITA